MLLQPHQYRQQLSSKPATAGADEADFIPSVDGYINILCSSEMMTTNSFIDPPQPTLLKRGPSIQMPLASVNGKLITGAGADEVNFRRVDTELALTRVLHSTRVVFNREGGVVIKSFLEGLFVMCS
ncbi:unnamed protein product [Urochloa humidicola]